MGGGVVNVYISIDMEGIAGIATIEQCRRGTDSFPLSQKLMTEEANAAIDGAIQGGATRVVVNDSHGDMTNLLPDLLDARAELTIGSPKIPGSMMQGLSANFGVALFVGYHAAAGVPDAVLAHTYSGAALYDVRLNGASMTEAELNGMLAATYGVPIGLVTGDDKICALAEKRFGGVRTVMVKQGLGRTVTTSIHPERARAAIREAAAATVSGAADLRVTKEKGPFQLEVDLVNLTMAELCSLIPGTERVAGRTVRFTSDDFHDVFRCLLAFTEIARP
jgi:D-amino peptidase